MSIISKKQDLTNPLDAQMRYPRRTLYRRFWRFLMRLFFTFFVDSKVSGRKSFPKLADGPVILVANHTGILEVAMMQAFAPYQMEFLTTGDVPLEPRVAWMANFYGFIPVKRGSIDRKAMSLAVSVLSQGGVVSLFPQGGIWDTKVSDVHTGVTWLSQKGKAVVVPIGFGGARSGLTKALKFQRPTVTMNVGKPIEIAPEELHDLSRKETLIAHTKRIMDAVYEIIPQSEKDQWHSLAERTLSYRLSYILQMVAPSTKPPPRLSMRKRRASSSTAHNCSDAMHRNLALPVGALVNLHSVGDARSIADALEHVVRYVKVDNPYFLTYRFGNEEGHAMRTALESLQNMARWAQRQGYRLRIKPIRRYRYVGQEQLIIQDVPDRVADL
ncbi:MAG UNVERIFIED_CONTAM: 1-acyl-sn-glycerol-3-phosphate acyltransferase [Anaerolineae bacterium]|jgi:1-acyl-sn-glycerol-3-phosphate acyltransferase